MDIDRYRTAERRLFTAAGIDPHEIWLTLADGVRVRVLEHGTGAPVVFLHGGPNAAATWSHVAAATTGVRCLLVDRPGCGLSDSPRTVPDNTTVTSYVSRLTIDILDILDTLELSTATLVGSSFGGFQALRTAIDHPDRVDRLALVGCPAFVPGWTAPGFFTLLRTPLLGRLLVSLPATSASVRMSLRQMGHRASLDAGRIDPAMLDWIRAWQHHTDTMRNDAAMIISCGTRSDGFDPTLDLTPDDLTRIEAAVLVLGGTDDPVGGHDVIERLATALPNATADCLPDAGHLPWLDNPTWVAQNISAFVTAR